MKNRIHDILADLGAIKSIVESYESKKTISQADYDLAVYKLKKIEEGLNALSDSGSEVDMDALTNAVEEKILAKLSSVVDTIIDRKITAMGNVKATEPAPPVPVMKEQPVSSDPKREEAPKEIKKSAPKKEDARILHDSIADKNKPGKSVYDVLSQGATGPDLSTKMAGQHIPNLEKAISLNEKFLFIKELFGGNAYEYSQALGKLNAVGSYEEAMSHVRSIYRWNESDPQVAYFLELLKRRYS